MNAPLFREEVLRQRTDRLHGNVTIATPIAWQVVGLLLLIALVATVVFLCRASYARVEVVAGVVSLDKGVPAIVPSRSGIVEDVLVREGDRVRRGERLAVIRADESGIDGKDSSQRTSAALKQQNDQLAYQAKLLVEAAAADQQRLAAQIEGDVATMSLLSRQIKDQQELIGTAQADYDNAVRVAARGFISKRDLDQRRATILTRSQQLAQLEQSQSDKLAEIAQARRAMVQADMSAKAQAANARSNRASVSQQQVQADLARGYALTAPLEGVVTGLTLRAGQPVSPGQQLMMVVPPKAKLRVELYIPTSAIGFIRPRQEVRLSIDAFNYQMFGTVTARVDTISQATIMRPGPNGPVPIYLVTATMNQPWIEAFGRRQSLLPGMTLSARIITERRTLVQWLFAPLFAVRRR